jgi:phospholipid/cholesterol/gamma-HCH transport system permease protein
MKALNTTIGPLGEKFFNFCGHIYRSSILTKDILFWLLIAPFRGKRIRWHSTFEQMVRIGVDSLPIVGMISFFVGLIMAMQGAYQLKPFGVVIYVANLVGVTITRELGPMLTAIIVAGRSGSAIAAEIGTMKVAEEIDALKTMGLNPIGFLVLPRILALLIVLPCLTILSDLIGIGGGFFIAVFSLKLPFIAYLNQSINALVMKDLVTGLIKSVFFALIIGQVGCYEGFGVKGGAEGVGRSTTASVVISIFMIITADVIFTALFFSTF